MNKRNVCPECKSHYVVEYKEREKFKYGEPDSDQVSLIADIISLKCIDCNFQYTDRRAEEARDLAVKQYLNFKEQGYEGLFL